MLDDKLLIGMALGFMVGAIVVHSSKKMQQAIDQGKEIIKDKEKPIFVYEADGKIEGYAFCILINHSNENSLCDYKSLYIDDLCVDENCRGRGIGKILYDYVLEYAKKIGCYNLTLNVWEGNDSAMRFYKNIGLKIQKIGMEKILWTNILIWI